MQNPDLRFVQSKIAEIRTALFFCSNNKALPLPAYIVRAIKTNENDVIWFFISAGWHNNVFHQGLFPGKLEFYRRGYPFALKIEGDVKLISNKSAIQDLMPFTLMDDVYNGVLLVSVKINRVIYKELINVRRFNPVQRVYSFMKKMLHAIPGRKYSQEKWQPSV
jgi:hypothetical protein